LSYLDFGLTLAGMWFATLTGAVSLIMVVEAFKRLGTRSEEIHQGVVTKPAAPKVEEQLTEEENTTIVALAAIQAYISEEQRGGRRVMKRKFKITIGGKSYEVEVEETTPPEPEEVLPPYIGPPKVLTGPPKRIVTPRPSTPTAAPRRLESPKPLTSPTLQPQPAEAKPAEEAKAIVSGETVKAPLPGVVVSIKVKEGDQVKQGDTLLILESMKMENALVSPRDGVVKRILVSLRASVQHGDPLVVLE